MIELKTLPHKIHITAIQNICKEINILRTEYNNRKFTIDGRLVGDIGEVLAELNYDIELDSISRPSYDATCDNRQVQIKATFQNKLTFKNPEGYYIGLQICKDGSAKEVFNGRADIIYKHYKNTNKNIGKTLQRFSISTLHKLDKQNTSQDRIPYRN